MGEFRFSLQAPSGWEAACRDESAVFGCPSWQTMLESSFGCHSLFAWNGADGAAITTFKAGPFSVGYLGFPAGRLIGDPAALTSLIDELALARAVAKLTCLRIPVSAFGPDPGIDCPSLGNPETAIADLQSWDLMGVSKNLRRDIRKAERSGLDIKRSSDGSLGPSLFAIYERTVKHRGGSLRYNARYFSELLRLSEENPAIQVFAASKGSDLAGFAVIVHHGNTAYYLHGGTVAELRHLSPSDLILADAIASARSAGCEVFNFMASPPDQPSLVRYKEKWGGETRQLRTYSVRLSWSYLLFSAAERLYRLMP